MRYRRTIVCLANSRKLQGRCVAGLEIKGQEVAKWLRPVGSAPKGELYSERLYAGYKDPQLLDIIEIEFKRPRPTEIHPEDHLVDDSVKWERKGTLSRDDLQNSIECVNGPLWVNAGSTSYGLNDVIPVDAAKRLGSSLKLVQPERLVMRLQIEGAAFGRPKRRVRGSFTLAGIPYELAVTDSAIEAAFKGAPEGSSKTVLRPILCLSVGEVFEKQNACYKLIAGVIE